MWNVLEDTLKSFIQTIYSFFTRRSKIHRGIRNKVLHLNLQRVSICKHRQLNKLRNHILCIVRVRSLPFLNAGSSKSAYSTYYLMKLVFVFLCFVFSVFSVSRFDVIVLESQYTLVSVILFLLHKNYFYLWKHKNHII